MMHLRRFFGKASRKTKTARWTRSRTRRLAFESLEQRRVLSTLNIAVENLSPEGGLFETPFWVGVHDGQFDVASLGRPASEFPGLELLAEEGDTGELSQHFQDTNAGTDRTILAPDGFQGAPVFDPEEVYK